MEIPQEVNPNSRPEPALSKEEAAYRVIKFHENMQSVNPFGGAAYDDGMRSALTYMLTGEQVTPTAKDAGLALRYVRDRISVPRDMSIWSAKRLRQACADVADMAGVDERRVVGIALRERRD